MRMPPTQNRFNRRTQSDYALAARMLLKLKKGEDFRPDRVADVRAGLASGTLDTEQKLNRAMDILLEELESEIEVMECDSAAKHAVKPEVPRFVDVTCMTPLRRRAPVSRHPTSANE